MTLPEYALDAGYVPRIWALRQVGRLLADVKMGNMDPALIDEAVAIATRFGVSTNFTYFAADAAGDVTLRYAAVPMAATGAAAVDTSSALRDYGSGSSVPMSTSTPTRGAHVSVRYVADRSLPVQGGYLTDTKLAPRGCGDTIDLTFGSDRYFAFAAAEAPFGAGALLSVGSNARFELLGRAFRITDPLAPASSATVVPPESSAVADPAWRPVPGNASSVSATTNTAVPPASPAMPGPVADPAVAGLAHRGGGCACAAAGPRDGDGRQPQRAGAGRSAAGSVNSLAPSRSPLTTRRARHRSMPVDSGANRPALLKKFDAPGCHRVVTLPYRSPCHCALRHHNVVSQAHAPESDSGLAGWRRPRAPPAQAV